MSDGPIWSQLLLQVVLIAINAFFAFSEIVLISLNESKLKHQAEEGDKKATLLVRLTEQPERFLSTIQIGITLAGFLASAFAADNFAGRLGKWLLEDVGITGISANTLNTLLVIGITIILSYFTLIFGELVPKRLAMKNPEKSARKIIGIIRGASIVFRPIVALLSASTNGVLRLCGIDPHQEDEQVTEEEIRMMVDIGEETGNIENMEKEFIENIFEFNNMNARDVMTHRTDVAAIWVEDTDEQIIATIEETGHSRFPVYDEDLDDIIGMMIVRDYFLNAQRKEPLPFQEIIRPVYFVPESVRTDILFRDMQKRNTHMAVVVDEYGGTSGIITMEDLLEEIVGNIYDEADTEEHDIIQLEENLWKIAGSVELDVLEETLDIKLPEEEYDTLGGLIYGQLNAIPEDGTKIELDVCGLHIKVEEISDRRVEWALVSKLPQEADAEEKKQKKE